jgi:hypothetical protein
MESWGRFPTKKLCGGHTPCAGWVSKTACDAATSSPRLRKPASESQAGFLSDKQLSSLHAAPGMLLSSEGRQAGAVHRRRTSRSQALGVLAWMLTTFACARAQVPKCSYQIGQYCCKPACVHMEIQKKSPCAPSQPRVYAALRSFVQEQGFFRSSMSSLSFTWRAKVLIAQTPSLIPSRSHNYSMRTSYTSSSMRRHAQFSFLPRKYTAITVDCMFLFQGSIILTRT